MAANIAFRIWPFQFRILALLAVVPFVRAQMPTNQSPPQPAERAGGRAEFEVATIKPAEPGTHVYPTVGLWFDDSPAPPGGHFLAQGTLPDFIQFAYSVMAPTQQVKQMAAKSPKWVGERQWVIEAKADGSPTKDQLRLMLRSLLEDRFRLATHFEAREWPVLVLVLNKPGMAGRRLRPHTEGLACDAPWAAPPDRTAPSVPPGGFVPTCGSAQAIDGPDHTVLFGARALTMTDLAEGLSTLPTIREMDRPVVDQTGLTGTFDFTLQWTLDFTAPTPSSISSTELTGPTLQDALKDELGLKLKPAKASVQVLVIDHVEPPSPN